MVIVVLMVTLAIIGTCLVNFSYAQIPTSASSVKDFVMSEMQKVKAESIFPEGPPLTSVKVEYESPQTLILEADSRSSNSTGKVIDFAKQKGYTLDATTVFTEDIKISDDSSSFFHYFTIFMSKK